MTTAQPLSLIAALAFSQRSWRRHWRLFLAVMLTVVAGWVVLELIVIAGQQLGFLFWFAAQLAFLFFLAGVQVGFMRLCLAIYDGQTPAYRDLFTRFDLSPALLLGQIIYGAALVAGLLFFIVPGLILGVRYVFFAFHVAEGEENLFMTWRKSVRLTGGYFWRLQAFLLLLVLLNLAGASLLGLGLLMTVPHTVLMLAAVYRQLDL